MLLIIAIMSGMIGCKSPNEPRIPEAKPIPTIYIYTENAAPIVSKVDYVNATFSLNGQGVCADIKERDLRIRGRGNSTWLMSKKPYRLNFNSAVSLFGLPAAKNWILLGSYTDPTFLFDPVGFELSRRLDMPWTNNIFFVEVYLNDNYIGLYQLTEHLKSNVGLTGNDILMELDNNMDEDFQFYSNLLNIPIMIQNPSSQAALDRAKVIWNNIENTLFGPVYENAPEVLDSNSGWRELFDVQSIMQTMLIKELLGNAGAILWGNSFWIQYLSSDGKIHFGPLWDFNDLYATFVDKPHLITDLMHFKAPTVPLLERQTPCSKFVLRFFDDPKFVKEYKQYCNSVIGKLNANRFIDSLVAVIKPYANKNYEIWGDMVLFDGSSYDTKDYAALSSWFKDFYNKRINAIKNYVKE